MAPKDAEKSAKFTHLLDSVSKLADSLKSMDGAPFTIQRLAELICEPSKHYKRPDKYFRALEKNLTVVTTVSPEGRRPIEASRDIIVERPIGDATADDGDDEDAMLQQSDVKRACLLSDNDVSNGPVEEDGQTETETANGTETRTETEIAAETETVVRSEDACAAEPTQTTTSNYGSERSIETVTVTRSAAVTETESVKGTETESAADDDVITATDGVTSSSTAAVAAAVTVAVETSPMTSSTTADAVTSSDEAPSPMDTDETAEVDTEMTD